MDMVILEYRLFFALFYFACFEHMCSWLPKGAQISIVDFAIYWNWNINDQIDARELYTAYKKKKSIVINYPATRIQPIVTPPPPRTGLIWSDVLVPGFRVY